jgi:hypothetical protein
MVLLRDPFEKDGTDRDNFWEGRALKSNNLAARAYLIFALGALALFALFAGETRLACLRPWQRLLVIGVGVVVSAGPPAWFWAEARAFDHWVNRKCKDEDVLAKRLRETFKVNADNEKAFWAAIVAVYAAVLLKW